MKAAVVYYSASGNTATVAQAIAGALGEDAILGPVDGAPALDDRELVFVGMPIERFGAPEPARRFLAEHCTGRRVALFVTHAAPEDLPDVEPWLEDCRAATSGAVLVGLFHCQGQLAAPVRDAMLTSGMPALVQFAEGAACADGQPDEAALLRAAAFASETVSRVRAGETVVPA
jgi:Flavodoxin domain